MQLAEGATKAGRRAGVASSAQDTSEERTCASDAPVRLVNWSSKARWLLLSAALAAAALGGESG